VPCTLDFTHIRMKMLWAVGGKNASLGEIAAHLGSEGIPIPDGFALTAPAYGRFLRHNGLDAKLCVLLRSLDDRGFSNLGEVGAGVRALIAEGEWPKEIRQKIAEAHDRLVERCPPGTTFAVRSSAIGEGLIGATFARQMDNFLHVSGLENLLEACRGCYASLYNDQAIRYRTEKGFGHLGVAMSVGVQRMVRSDRGASGIAFTPETGWGNSGVIVIDSTWGLGTGGTRIAVTPDEFRVSKVPGSDKGLMIVGRRLGSKETTLVYEPHGDAAPTLRRVETSPEKREAFSLPDEDVLRLAEFYRCIADHYGQPMDVEWAKDGPTGQLCIVQARPCSQRPTV
jgi:pyruvate,water dikinase